MSIRFLFRTPAPPVLHCREVSPPTVELGHELPRHLAGSAVEVPPKPAAPLRDYGASLPHSAAGMNPCPTVIKS